MSKQFYFKQFSLAWIRSFDIKTVLFQAIPFSISTQFRSFWTIDRTLSDATTPGQSGPGSDGNEGVHRIPQSSRITGTSLSDSLVLYPEYGGGSYSSAKVQSVYSIATADWAKIKTITAKYYSFNIDRYWPIDINCYWDVLVSTDSFSFGLVSLFYCILTFVDHLIPKPFF